MSKRIYPGPKSFSDKEYALFVLRDLRPFFQVVPSKSEAELVGQIIQAILAI